jgi:predicted nucleic acid-binding protein
MIVVDASVVVDLLLELEPHAPRIAERLALEPEMAAPHLLDAEVGQVLRRYVHAGNLGIARAQAALVDLSDMPIVRYPHVPFLQRAFDLRDNVTFYDALYIVLAEALGAPLLTRDAPLGSIPGHRADVEVVA